MFKDSYVLHLSKNELLIEDSINYAYALIILINSLLPGDIRLYLHFYFYFLKSGCNRYIFTALGLQKFRFELSCLGVVYPIINIRQFRVYVSATERHIENSLRNSFRAFAAGSKLLTYI